MANNPSTLPAYSGQTDPVSAAYPLGSARDDAVPGDFTGTPRVADEINDTFGFYQALLAKAGVSPSGLPDTALVSQYLIALETEGMMTWSPTTEYVLRNFAIDPTDGLLYVAAATSTNVQPSTDIGGDWAGGAVGISIQATEGNTILQTAVNNRMRRAANLSDVSNASTARTNLDVYSKSQVDGITTLACILFDGTGVPSISASKNIASVTDLGTGQYEVTFDTALASANYTAVATASEIGSTIATSANFTAKTATGFELITTRESGGTFIVTDFDDISVVVTNEGVV